MDKMEMRTGRTVSFLSDSNTKNVLVSSKVLDNAAKMVIRIGPNSGWKLSA